ncbi:glycosyltransferase family 2 protein [Candidatus Gracilibacteria bacterium]|nr:glycosyltransferase family 2 protein [Candidatus Gracilibacteria bacterium]
MNMRGGVRSQESGVRSDDAAACGVAWLGVDVIIPTRNRADLIPTLLESLSGCHYPQLTIWVIDQSDDDATARAITPYVQADRACAIFAARGKASVRRVMLVLLRATRRWYSSPTTTAV